MTQASQPTAFPGEPHWHPTYGPLVPITLTLDLETVAWLMELAAMEGVCPARVVARRISDEAVNRGLHERDYEDGRWLPRPGSLARERDQRQHPWEDGVRLDAQGRRPWQVRLDAYEEAVKQWAQGRCDDASPAWIETAAPDTTAAQEAP